ncbi:DMSO/TMAO reductase YedYZ, molybdopterin-dependent catalytic subunit [Streptomyces sp. 3213]|uniref:molybdopterin-dependent oxidoreductase n=1 Tax=Streptomyces sp. 3213.3 TaxID=1855348 RepID=UPI00089B8A49|nr:molybdopterin-dependent oxidoreductase [Streptomyces sp. 3213.3]SEC31697.1 DMSO/TMAO reductase YedYZ, molybdopterin-dependent catalytic subunit [Streptomyces sp. 3213] [Streptomyces sp. 3213.3]
MGTWQHGAAAALFGVGTAEILAALWQTGSPVDAAGKLVVDNGPRPVVERTVKYLRAADKPTIRALVAGTAVGAGAVLGRTDRSLPRDLAVTAAGAAGSALALRRRGASDAAGGPQPARALGTAAAGGLATLLALSLPPRGAPALALAGGGALTAALRARKRQLSRHDAARGADELKVARPLPPPRDGAESWPGVSALMTPPQDFYVTDVAMRPPLVDPDTWRLDITGACASPLRLSYAQLLARDLVEFDAVLSCVHNRLGWGRLGNQRWTGLPLRDLIDEALPHAAAGFLVTRATDGWECTLPLDLVRTLDAYVVVGMAGRPLSAAHGFPARVFVPGIYGQFTGAKWLTELRLTEHPNQDYWLPRGWPREPVPVRPTVRIDTPAAGRLPSTPVVCAGVAWAPPYGVEAVEVRVDGGPWQTAELADELAPAAWRRWRLPLSPPPGPHTIQARCAGRGGVLQSAVPREPFPTGASGYHTVAVTTTA